MPYPPLPPAARPSGYGLVELAIALAVVAILAAMALPSFQRTLAELRADSLRLQLHALLSTARSTAITRRQRIEACPSSDGITCGRDWARGWLLYPAPRTPLRPGKAPKKVLLIEQRAPSTVKAPATLWRTRMQFRPDGRNAGVPQTICIYIGKRQHSELRISMPGRVRSRVLRRAQACAD
ncbi:GspH/FimT family protein [Stenotrophomonas chelatiphaga]|uniref:GspH/FimT family protein n=1 Tax=Stenotrophomonas chelatiphaga TaxID=517011 RepID=UPI002898A455|nr:GspH/FimT family pseudopilin [Stenotrophomonas chelatiphaga]